jgi:hypothetical protein
MLTVETSVIKTENNFSLWSQGKEDIHCNGCSVHVNAA